MRMAESARRRSKSKRGVRRMVPPFEAFGKAAQPGLPQIYSSRPKGIRTTTVRIRKIRLGWTDCTTGGRRRQEKSSAAAVRAGITAGELVDERTGRREGAARSREAGVSPEIAFVYRTAAPLPQ